MADLCLEVNNLRKNFGTFEAVKGISFSVKKGQVVGLLGPNGAGKTTTIQMLLGIMLPTSGVVNYFGKNFSKHRQESLQRINFASAFNTLQGRNTVFENLKVFGLLYEVKNLDKKIVELSEYFEITALMNQRYWDLSAGQKTRVNLVKSLINDPELILMDEPTASLDPDIADKTLTLIEKLRAERNLSLLFTSHNMNEVTRICDEVIFLDHGSIVAQDTPLNLTKLITKAYLKLTFEGDHKKVESYLTDKNLKFEFKGKNTVAVETEESLIPKIIFGIGEEKIWVLDIEVEKPNLEDVFLTFARKENKTDVT